MSTTLALRETERWFYRRGLPFFVADYRSSTDVWTRATPFLASTFVIMVLLAAANLEDPLWTLVGLGVAAALISVYVVRNVRAGRSWRALPARVTWPVLAVYVTVPTLVAFVSVGTVAAVVEAFLIAAALLGLAFVTTRYAVIALVVWALRYTLQGVNDLYRLATRALPLMLIFITFLFINTEVWQVAGTMSVPRLWIVIAVFALLGIAVIVGRIPHEVELIGTTTDASVVVASCAGTPLADVASGLEGLGEPAPLTGRQRRNLGLVMTVAQLVQVSLFAFVVWLFFVLLGAVAVSLDLQAAWLNGLSDVVTYWTWGTGYGITQPLLRVSLFLGAFAGFYVTIYTATDGTYREHFYDRIRVDLEDALYVRRAYVRLRARG